MSSWLKCTWGDLVTLEYGKSLRDYDQANGNIPVYGTNGKIGTTDKILCPFPSVVIGRKGAYRGVHYSDSPFFVIDTAFYVKPKSSNLNLKFAYYCLKTYDINGMDSGSAIPSTSREDFYNLPAIIPDLPTQTAIAEILSSLDDKIELNHKINRELEALAQALFKRWFVDFEFPDENGQPYRSAGGEMVESELGEIPKTWKTGRIAEEFNLNMGQSPKGDTYNEIGEGMVFFQGRSDFGFRFPKARMFTTDPKKIADKFETLISVRAPVGDLNVAYERCCIGRGLGAISHKHGCSSYTYYKMLSIQPELKSYDNEGTVFGSINKETLGNIKVVIPSISIVSAFEEICKSIDDLILNTTEETNTLIVLRNTLLPKLISGEIEISV